MTREELRDYVEEQRNLDIIPYHVYSTLIDGIDTLEQQPCEDAISREDAIKTAIEAADDWDGGYNLTRADIIEKAIKSLPSVQPKLTECEDAISRQVVRDTIFAECKDCKWWKDRDGVYRRGVGAESQCPINRREVFEGNGYCYMFEPHESEETDASSN